MVSRFPALLPGIFLLLFVGLGLDAALAATGTAVGVDPQATAQTGSDRRTLVVGADLSIGDVVTTGPSGEVQILFDDNTRLVVGHGSSLTIEDYLLRADGSPGELAVNALAGTFRFITGNAAKSRYLVRTPTGNIGVRGTAFDFSVTPQVTTILLHHGAILACSLDNQCIDLTDTCELGQYGQGDAFVIGHADTVRGAARDTLRSMFVYSANQNGLLREFRVPGADRCLKRSAPTGGKDSLSDPGSGEGSPNRYPPKGLIGPYQY